MECQNTPPRTITDLMSTSTLSEYTHESSGFGSLMHDQSAVSSLSSYSRSADRSAPHSGWPMRNLISIENDTSDISFDQSCMHDSASQLQSPIRRTEYQRLNAAVTVEGTERQFQSALSGGMSNKIEDSSDQEALIFQGNTDSGQQTVSGRQSRMLEENLASVARYVEELTGCGTKTGGAVSTNTIKSDLTHHLMSPPPPPPPPRPPSQNERQNQKQHSPQRQTSTLTSRVVNEDERLGKATPAEEILPPASGSTSALLGPQPAGETCQLGQLEQLQQLNQQLSALASASAITTASQMNRSAERGERMLDRSATEWRQIKVFFISHKIDSSKGEGSLFHM